MEVVHARCCGLDVHKNSVMGAAGDCGQETEIPHVHADLKQLGAWRKNCRVAEIASEHRASKFARMRDR